MKITGEHALAAAPERVWDGLQDPQLLADALPGAKRLVPTGPDEYELEIAAGVGAAKGVYEGTFALRDKVEPERCVVEARLRGAAGAVSATARMQLDAGADGGSRLAYELDAEVTGAVAGVGQRMLAAVVRRTASQFLDALDARLTAPADAAPAAASGDTRAAGGCGPRGMPRRLAPAGDVGTFAAGMLAGLLCVALGVLLGRRPARP